MRILICKRNPLEFQRWKSNPYTQLNAPRSLFHRLARSLTFLLAIIAVLDKIQELGYAGWQSGVTLNTEMLGSSEKHQAWIFRRNVEAHLIRAARACGPRAARAARDDASAAPRGPVPPQKWRSRGGVAAVVLATPGGRGPGPGPSRPNAGESAPDGPD